MITVVVPVLTGADLNYLGLAVSGGLIAVAQFELVEVRLAHEALTFIPRGDRVEGAFLAQGLPTFWLPRIAPCAAALANRMIE
ncbi:hypothetical protein [Streptomyces sp. RLB3-6]|uniref:hypothetical protein n=1 Tax=Streptomyces sp. RLB3-6 TaxID=2594457 RepID=UPI001164A9FF|nr:hypothetical protein [Streptomyces sp. RLB3-6]QDN93480.1 hypothetical protein FNV61_56430 [Streptomyces sp. RLB3-6]